MPCGEGTHANQTEVNLTGFLSSLDQCLGCPAGTYCGLGSNEPTPCPSGTFNSQSRSSRCTECPDGTTTVGTGTTSLEGCVCKVGQYDTDPVANATQCAECEYASTDCREVGAGVTLETLPLKQGYWRASARSDLLRLCFSDFCEGGSEGSCVPGGYCNGYCAEHHAGPFCELCVVGFTKRPDGVCVECSGDITLSFIFPMVVVLLLLAAVVSFARRGHLHTLAGVAFEAGKEAANDDECMVESMGEGMLGGVADAAVEDVTEAVKDRIKAALGLLEAEEVGDVEEMDEAAAPAVSAQDDTPSEDTPVESFATATTPPPSPPSPPSLDSPEQAVPALRQKSSRCRLPSAAELSKRVKALAQRIKASEKRMNSWQVKARILISLMQVLTALGVTFSIPYPPVYDTVVGYLGVFSLDLFEIMPLDCTIDFNHDHSLLLRTLLPILLLVSSLCYRRHLQGAAAHDSHPAMATEVNATRKGESIAKAKANKLLADQLLTYNFVLIYLLFPSNSAAIFATFQCEELDDADRSSYLRIDFSVDCNTPFHQLMIWYAALMVFVYPIGVPALYAYLLFYRHGNDLKLLKQIACRRAAIENEEASAAALSAARRAAETSQTTRRRALSHKIGPRLGHLGHFLDRSRRLGSALDRTRAPQRSLDLHAARGLAAGGFEAGRLSRISFGEASDAGASTQMDRLEIEEESRRAELPNYVQKLILGYELRVYYFELFECFRKLAIVCLPVFIPPSGSVPQLIFGLVVCFLTFGAHMLYNPYVENGDDRLAQLCQVQIFFALLSSIALKYDEGTLRNATNMDVLLTVLIALPILLAFYLEVSDALSELDDENQSCRAWLMLLRRILPTRAHSQTHPHPAN